VVINLKVAGARCKRTTWPISKKVGAYRNIITEEYESIIITNAIAIILGSFDTIIPPFRPEGVPGTGRGTHDIKALSILVIS